jgi:hypothetical protein
MRNRLRRNQQGKRAAGSLFCCVVARHNHGPVPNGPSRTRFSFSLFAMLWNLGTSESRKRFLILTAFSLVAAVAVTTNNSDSFLSLASIRISSGDIPLDANLGATSGHSSDPSDSPIFNPEFDLDGPSPDIPEKAKPMGEDDIQSALAGLAKDSTESLGRHSHEPVLKTQDIFDPSKDPDAPRPKLSALQEQELSETRRANQMKAQLKIEAQLAMLTERQNLKKASKDHSEKKLSDAKTLAKKDVRHTEPTKPFVKPSFLTISEEVRKSLAHGDDPSKIITKELQSEMQASVGFFIL